MARKKRVSQQLISMADAAALCGLHRWQVRRVCLDHKLDPVPNPVKPDKRYKWFSKDRLVALLAAEYMLPIAS